VVRHGHYWFPIDIDLVPAVQDDFRLSDFLTHAFAIVKGVAAMLDYSTCWQTFGPDT